MPPRCCVHHGPWLVAGAGPNSKYTHISEDVIPAERASGVTDKQITKCWGQPAALFTGSLS